MFPYSGIRRTSKSLTFLSRRGSALCSLERSRIAAEEIFNYLRVDDHISTSGQPTEAQLTALAKSGISVVINLAPHDHPKSLKDEADYCRQLGVEYINIPVAFDKPTEKDYAIFCDTMKQHSNDRLHIHCTVNARVTAFLYRYDVEISGKAEQQARAQMQKIWKPGGVWARFIGDSDREAMQHDYAGREYPRSSA